MTPELELQRARELALASQNVSQLFWIFLIGGAVILGFWTVVRWSMARRAKAKERHESWAQSVRVASARSKMTRDERRWNSVMDQIGWDKNARGTVSDPIPTKRPALLSKAGR